MAYIKPIQNKTPKIDTTCWLSDTCVVLGQVEIGANSSVWYHAILRGDVGSIKVGARVNIQDGVVIHSTYQKSEVLIGNDVTIGHKAIIHGCTIEDNVLIGMGAILLDHVKVQANSIVAAGAVVPEKTVIPSYTMWAGVPARQIKELEKDSIEQKHKRMAESYITYSDWHKITEK